MSDDEFQSFSMPFSVHSPGFYRFFLVNIKMFSYCEYHFVSWLDFQRTHRHGKRRFRNWESLSFPVLTNILQNIHSVFEENESVTEIRCKSFRWLNSSKRIALFLHCLYIIPQQSTKQPTNQPTNQNKLIHLTNIHTCIYSYPERTNEYTNYGN